MYVCSIHGIYIYIYIYIFLNHSLGPHNTLPSKIKSVFSLCIILVFGSSTTVILNLSIERDRTRRVCFHCILNAMNRIKSRTRNDIPIIFDNYKLKKWLFRAGPCRQELLRKIYQIRNMDSKNKKGYRKATHDYAKALTLRGERRKLKHDLEKLNLSKSGLRRALLQLTTESYVVVDRLSKEIISSINDKDRAQGFARRTEEFIPFFLDDEYNQKDNRNKKDLNNSEDIRKSSKCSDERYDEELDADNTSQIISMLRCTKPRVNQIKIDGFKFKHKFDHEEISKGRSIDKKVSTQNNRNGIIPNNNDTDVIKVPIQINRERLRRPILGASNELREKEFTDDKGCCFSTRKTMEADSDLSNDKINDTLKVHDNDIDINELKTVRQCELRETVIIDKIQKNCNISDIFNRTYSSVDMRKRKKIRDKFHEIFDQCLTLSEEEEEEFIINACIRTRQRKKYKKLSNVDKNIEYPVVLDKANRQDITSDLIVDTACRKTCEISSIELVETLLNTRNVREFDEDQTVCDKDVFTMEIELCGDDSVEKDNIIKFPLLCDNNNCDNNEEIEMNLSNELPTKTSNVSVIDDIAEVTQAEEAHNEIVESTESIKVETNESSDFSIYNRNFNDTNVEVLTNNAIKIRTLCERTNNTSSSSSSNNNNNNDNDNDNDNNNNNGDDDDDDDKITCHVSRNSYSKEVQLDRDSDDASIKTTVTSAAVNSDVPVEKILEKSRDRENLSKTSKADTSFETPKKIDDAMIANINFTESSARNINDNNADIEVEIKPTYIETCENTQSNPKVYDKENMINDDNLKSSKQDINEDLGQLLRMNIDQNYRIESIGNTISIQENVESYRNQTIIVKDICKNQLSSNNDSTNNNGEIEVVLEESTFGIIEENNDTSVIKRDNEKINDSSFNTIDFEQHSKLDDCPYNFIQSKGIKGNKIRVLSSAELGSRWCPTPVDTSLTEPINALVNETTVPRNVNDTPSERTTDRKRSTKDAIILDNKYPSLSYTEYYLMSIHRRIMRIRALEKKFSSNDRRNVSAKVKELINNNMRFNSNFIVLLEELLNLGKELKIKDLKKVIRYAASVINKSFLTPGYKPISLQEIANYMTLFDKSISETFTFTSNASSKSNFSNASTFTFDNGFTSTSNDLSATIAPAISKQLSNNTNNVAQVVLTDVQNLHAPAAAAEVQVIYNDLPKKNVYTSIGPNQKQECIVPNLQISKKSNTSILYGPPPPPAATQSMHSNVQLLKENRQLYKTSMPCYGQQSIQQQFIPRITFYNPANSNSMQSHNNKYITRRLNLNENVQCFIGNNAKYASQMAGQSNTVSHRIDNPRDMSKLSYARQASQQINMSYNVPQRFPIQMAQDIKSSQISCSMTLSAQLPMVHFNNSENLLQRINKIPCELLVQIWDQVTFCLEESFFDCRAHEIYDKGTCVLKLFHVGWKEKIYKFIRYKSRQSSTESITNLKSKLAKYIYKTATMEAQKSIWQVYLQKQKSQQLTDTMKILIQDMISKNHVNVESKCGSKTEASRSSKSQKEELDNIIKLEKQSDLRSLKNLTEDINKSDAISNILQSTLPVDNKFDNELVSINEMNRNEGDAVEPFTSLQNILSESGVILSNLRNKDIRVKEGNITDNTDPRRLDSRESPISSDPPHIIDVRSISPTSFNTIKEVLPFPINDLQLSNINDDTKENGIEIKIQIPEDVICLNCSKISTVVCEICLEAHYCSKECAASHWIEKHHKYCKPHCVIGAIERKTCLAPNS
ncbi:putative histone-lysine N-methyltransferase 1 isoform X3 [Vespa mandarinia]|uniref:putative histone-lysine N-methyltransferase 1 isoform X3 n=1 Tax=Vespa mandarinia TaxID=7446 RepID=UPI00160E9A05|nr:putative histone-lysine N-methyltransferase 1 isoform X3 [Vespa mandarinia]